MWIIHLILKPAFAAILLFVLLPYFSRTKKLFYFLGLFVLLLTVFLVAENQILNYNDTHSHEMHGGGPFTWMSVVVYLLLTFICFAIYFTKEWVRYEKQKRVLVETQLTSELNYLKSQINPHFLFNTLNNLFSIAQKHNVTELEYGISRLSGLMRYMIYESNVDLVLLSKEIKHLRDFIGICQLRFKADELTVNFDEKGDIGHAYIAPMLLLPFVENACKHGVGIETVSVIDISVEVKDKKIIFNCKNDIRERTEITGGIGLANVKKRLQLLYPAKHGLSIWDDGSKYHVCLTLITEA